MIGHIHSSEELMGNLKKGFRSFLLIYKSGSEKSDCANSALNKIELSDNKIRFLKVDVNKVKDIHPIYNITSAPSLLEFEGNKLLNVIKGCHDVSFYQNLIEHATYNHSSNNTDKQMKSVTVYSTPNCSWCNTLKSYLRKNHIIFNDIDVSRNEQAARDMVNRSGQQGVPQSIINGQVVVGFDKKKIDSLLEIK